MKSSRIFHTYTFRFIVLYVLTISILASLISTGIYLLVSHDYIKQVNKDTQWELDKAVKSFESRGISGFKDFLLDSSGHLGERYFFVLTEQDGRTIQAGNMDKLPDLIQYPKSSLYLIRSVLGMGKSQKDYFVGRSTRLASGQVIVAARQFEDINQRVELVASTLMQATILTILLGVIGGAYISAVTTKRIDSLNQSIVRIMKGDLSERLPGSNRGGEINQLAEQLNIMLDRIESSMNDVKQVSDSIAHDLRTPLTRLRNKLSTLEKKASPDIHNLVREMLVESDHLLSICSALMRIAKVESGAKRADFTNIDIAQIFVDVVELYEPLAGVKSIDLSIESAQSVPIHGDKDLLFQMLVNLIDNSIKYTPEGGAIMTKLYVKNGMIHIIFADNGVGIPSEKYEKIFQRFYRVEESRGVQPGNGLGLTLVQAVTQLHGGSIKLSDSSEYFPGNATKGLTLDISIPVEPNYPV